jgi:hypothetical protein
MTVEALSSMSSGPTTSRLSRVSSRWGVVFELTTSEPLRRRQSSYSGAVVGAVAGVELYGMIRDPCLDQSLPFLFKQ